MQEKFLSKELIKDIERILGKTISEITENDIKNITSLTLNRKKNFKEEKDYIIKDLIWFENLNVLSISNFKLIAEDVASLNLLKNLNFVHLDFCELNLNKLDFNDNVEDIVLNVCSGLTLEMLENSKAKNIKIIGSSLEMKSINIEAFKLVENLKTLSINNYTINSINALERVAPQLVKMNLDGSKLNENIETLKIDVSHEPKFMIVTAL